MSSHRTAPAAALLGALLVRARAISQEQLEEALAAQAEQRRRLGEILVERGWVTLRALSEALAEQFGLDFVDLAEAAVDDAAARLLPEPLAREYCAIPTGFDDEGRLVVAISNPADAAGVTSIRSAVARPVRLVVAETAMIEEALRGVYRQI